MVKVDKYIRDGDRVKKTLTSTDKGLITTTGCKVYLPKHYLDGKLGSMEEHVRTIGFFAIVIEDLYYAVNKTCATLVLSPDAVNIVTVEETAYMELTFDKGSLVISGTEVVKNRSLLFLIYDEIVAKGKTPWYMSYADLGSLFDSSRRHAGVDLKAPRSILEMMAASRARNPKDRAAYYRNMLQSQADYNAISPDIIPLRSVSYGATNTTARLLGSYLNEGISSSLVNPSQKTEHVEDLLLS